MKKYFVFLILILYGISSSYAENQKYVISDKSGKTRLVPVAPEGDKWRWNGNDIYVENGAEVEGFQVEKNRSLNYSGSPYVYRECTIVKYEDNYYVVPFPEKSLKPVKDTGELTSDSGLGIRNYLSNTRLGDFYRTPLPGLLALLCAFVSGVIIFYFIFTGKENEIISWLFAIPLCFISLLEIGAAFSVGTDAAWWVNPEDVGYWIATPLLIPYAIVAALMVFSYKLYGVLGHIGGIGNLVISILLFIGIGLTVISAIFVVINFLFAACLLIFAGWLFKGVDVKNSDGSSTNFGPLGNYRTDRNGNTTHIR